jgi:hypothetical protein
MLKRILSLEEEVEAFVTNNQEQIIAINRSGCRGHVQICYLEDVKKFIVMFIPLETLLAPEYQEIITTNGNFVEHLIKKVKIYDPNTQIVIGYQSLDLETYSVIISFESS